MTLLMFERVLLVFVSCFDMESSLLELFKHISRVVELQILQRMEKINIIFFTETKLTCVSYSIIELESLFWLFSHSIGGLISKYTKREYRTILLRLKEHFFSVPIIKIIWKLYSHSFKTIYLIICNIGK